MAGKKTLLVILGPTASGKTGVAIRLAKYLKTEIISADSRQFYREIPIGTAAPTEEQLREVPHHFVGNLSLQDDYNVSRFERDVLKLLEQKFRQHEVIIMAGGSGLYIDAVCKGIDALPDPDPQLRQTLEKQWKQQGIAMLQQQLEELDPDYYAVVDRQNPKRLMRAIEVCLQTGKKYSELRLNRPAERDFRILKIGLNLPRQELFERIHQRTDQMLENGWLEEARRVLPFREKNALNTVGYKELFAFFDGKMTLEEAVEKIKTNTRRYAKRQLTWFKRDTDIHWFSPEETDSILAFVRERINEE
ncbi:tRNA (adenosine(37)-N6)-dimethylallyltransferase MiaA [Candidatus Sulfidibacterium hydrothermale]|uniref:tRNA (adenosine(37)-N6)-dimethylallyltransferase MiaA n=1 Tax=Candidatus Sulfidibacterium hydrothermale TaxID=2875962 RepID=UPI001F0B1ACD|nr:tRNA (adenosine(37)-N6)-dimethylallyltransferase MiaA [Candidatus Sulfidibacterium hydrothermale]UBM61063.1 tRNA (adenosine(37)-N6)-dimethylallyltransferase MiaA [Candidatus Sulfidibacterium hydrothermale]